MASIPRSSRKVLPSGAVATAQIPFDIADTGQIEAAKGLGRIGQAVGDVANVFSEIEIRDRKAQDLTQGTRDSADRTRVDAEIELWKRNTPLDQHTRENFEQQYDDRIKFDESLYKSEEARTRAEIIHDAERLHFIDSEDILAQDGRIKVGVLSTHDTYIDNPTEENLQNYRSALSLTTTGERADDLILRAQGEIALNSAINLANNGEIEQAREVIDATEDSMLDEKEKLAANRTISSIKTQVKTRDEIALEESAASVEPDWLEKWATGRLTMAEVIEWSPSLTDPEAIRKHVDIQEEWIRKVGSAQGKAIGYNAVVRDIDLNTKNWNPTRIYAQVPKNITSPQATALVKHLKAVKSGGNSGSTALHSRYQAIAKSQQDIGAFGNKNTDDSKNALNDISLKLTNFMVENPKATTDQWNKFYAETTTVRKKTGFLGKLFRLTPIGAGLRILDLRSQLKDLNPRPGENVPQQGTFNEGDTLPDQKTGQVWMLIKKGNTPAEDVWAPQETP